MFHSAYAGAIAGGTVGGVAFIGGAVIIVICICKKSEEVSGSELTHILHN